MPFTLNVNGKSVTVDVPADMPLLWVLRDVLDLRATKFGCGLGQCGACTVMMDGKAVRSCQTRVDRAAGHAITTIEGLGTPAATDRVQSAFIAEQAAQCGYCMSGIVVAAAALLAVNKKPSEKQVREALDKNLCRCGSHNRVVKAVMRAANE